MTRHDEQIVQAAQAVLLWRCVDSTDDLSAAGLANVTAILTHDFVRPQWLYGFWDAPLLVSHGPDPVGDWITPGPTGVDDDIIMACRGQDDVTALGIIDTSQGDPAAGAVTNQLMSYSMQGWQATVADPRFTALRDVRSACLEARGYSTEDDDLGSVSTPATWTAEQNLQVFLAQARCSDDEDFTQQAGDINASYEQQIVDAHEAELVTIKQMSDDRVTRASQILRDAGIL